MDGYTIWKLAFAYAQQPTVIDIACSVRVIDDIITPSYIGKPCDSICNEPVIFQNLNDLIER